MTSELKFQFDVKTNIINDETFPQNISDFFVQLMGLVYANNNNITKKYLIDYVKNIKILIIFIPRINHILQY